MKLLLSLFISVICFFSYSQTQISVNGKITNAQTQTVTVQTFAKGAFKPLTIDIVDNEFTVSLPVEDIEFYRFQYAPNVFSVLIAEPGQNVSFTLDVKDIIGTISFTGSPNTQLVYNTEKRMRSIHSTVEKLHAEQQVAASQEQFHAIQIKIDSVQQIYNTELIEFVKSNMDNPANVFFIENLDIDEHIDLYVQFSENIQKKYPENEIIQNIINKTNSAKATALGAFVKDIRLPGINGDTIGLFPLTGKLTIIDFWASWCSPCRKSNPYKSEAYQKYKDKGLVYFSISLDQNGTSWKNAIQQDKLNWTNHVSELKGWQSSAARQFGVSSIPANFIIDDKGKILAKNKRGEELMQFLEQYLGK